MDKKLQVVLDPALELEDSELRAQWEAAMELRDMLSTLNLALHALDNIEFQAKNLQQTINHAEEIPEAMAESVENVYNKAVYIREHISIEGRNINWTPGYIYGKVNSLFSMIDGTNAPLTLHQLEFLEEVRVEFGETIKKVNTLITEDIPDYRRYSEPQSSTSKSQFPHYTCRKTYRIALISFVTREKNANRTMVHREVQLQKRVGRELMIGVLGSMEPVFYQGWLGDIDQIRDPGDESENGSEQSMKHTE